MTTDCTSQLDYRLLRAPRRHGTALVDPPFAKVGKLVDKNVRLREEHDYDFQGRRLADLSRQARRELLQEARRWTTAYRDVGPSSAEQTERIFLVGHQPEIFHPGVWLKNFALDSLARRHGAAAVNLLIDGDTCKSTALRVPGGTVSEPHVEIVPFDRPQTKLPYENRRIVDRELFADFALRVQEQIAPLVSDPLINQYWPLVQQRMQQTDNLGACLAQARHKLEAQWGLSTLEVPQSRVCETGAFCWFVVHLLARLPDLWKTYNEAVHEYRRMHRIRSTAHPVPDLLAEGEWLEAPLWVFSAEDPRRRRLFVRQKRNEIVLSDRQALEIGLPLRDDGDAAAAVERLIDLHRRGVKIRSRALITTLWARLALGDLFLHGIGGAKYDHLTDVLIHRFLRLKPPGFVVFSATLHLPICRERVSVEQAGEIRHQLRRLVYHPERYINGSQLDPLRAGEDPIELIAAKLRCIQTPQTVQNAPRRCREIRRINEALQPWVHARRRRLMQLQAETSRALRAESVLAWRQYGFCLYEEDTFREFVRGLLPKNA